MNVKDLLTQCDKEELIAVIMDNEGIEEEDQEDMHLMYEVFLIKLRDIIPKESGHVLLFMEWSQGDEKWDEAALYAIEEIISDFHRNEEVESLNDDFQLPKEEMNRILSEIQLPVSYAYEFSSWEEILGYEVFVPNVIKCGISHFLALVIYEMTFFGFEESEMEEERDKLKQTVDEVEEILKLPEEEQQKYFTTFDDVKAELGYVDCRTEEEREADEMRECREALVNKIRSYRVLREYFDYSLCVS